MSVQMIINNIDIIIFVYGLLLAFHRLGIFLLGTFYGMNPVEKKKEKKEEVEHEQTNWCG